MAAVALTGARKAAIEGWLDTPVGGKMLDDAVRLPLKAGAVAQGIDVTVAVSLSVNRGTFEQDCRDFCDDCLVTPRSLQNMFRDWLRGKLTGAGAGIDVSNQVNLLVRADVAAGVAPAETATGRRWRRRSAPRRRRCRIFQARSMV